MEIAVRGYFEATKKQKQEWEGGIITPPSDHIVLAFDTETTVDKNQMLRFGSCSVHIGGKLTEFILFYNDTPGAVKSHEIETLEAYAKNHQADDKHSSCTIELMTRTEFVEKVLTPYCYRAGARLVGFNLPFDISRLAIHWVEARKTMRGGFTFKLSDNSEIPRIAIKHIDSTKSFIKWRKPLEKRQNARRRKANPGRFLELRTLAFALTNEHYRLEKACEAFGCKHEKGHPNEHGKITPEYIGYNINDTMCTHELYEKELERYRAYYLDKDPSQIYSPASIGKTYLQQMGITSFLDKNPNFPKEILGYLMTAYYGARVEVKHRKAPVRVTNLDFTSMYPTLYVLMGIDRFLKADHIEYEHNPGWARHFLDTITREALQDKEVWKKMTCICRVKPEGDLLPVRGTFSGKDNYNISLCYVNSEEHLWYSLPDLIASKIQTGKTPRVEDAIIFTPVGKQTGLKPITIYGGIEVSPDEDLIQKLIEKRKQIRDKKPAKGTPEDIQQNVLKIIANSIAYGIFIELITETLLKKHQVTVQGLTKETIWSDKIEKPGPMFNPAIGITITAGAKLILSIAESLIKPSGGEVYYCDTDSVFVDPQHVNTIQDWFQPINPYSVDMTMFKVELADVWFYGISDKRYCLYDIEDGTFIIKKPLLHGLGYLLFEGKRDTWVKQAWTDILTVHYHKEKLPGIRAKYVRQRCVYQQTVTTPGLSKNTGGLWPFNFVIRGIGLVKEKGERISPLTSYVSPEDPGFKNIAYQPFWDPRTGIEYTEDTESYWKTMDDYLFGNDLQKGYADHPEYKLDGETGKMERKHVEITSDMIVHVGKESNNWEKRLTAEGTSREDYLISGDPERFKAEILKWGWRDFARHGIGQANGRRIQRRIQAGGSPGRKLLQELTRQTKRTIN